MKNFDMFRILEAFPSEEVEWVFESKFKYVLDKNAPPCLTDFVKEHGTILYEAIYTPVYDELEMSSIPKIFTFECNGVKGVVGYYISDRYGNEDNVFNILCSDSEDDIKKFTNDVLTHLRDLEKTNAIIDGDPAVWDATIIDAITKNNLEEVISDFLDSREFYEDDLGIGWKTGIILYGPPGNGKTRLIKAIAQKFSLQLDKIDDYIKDGTVALPNTSRYSKRVRRHNKAKSQLLNIEVPYADWEDLYRQKYPFVEKPIIIVAEDLDKVLTGKYNSDSPIIRLSNLLNAIDGVDETSGTIIIATTNVPENLPQAILSRPGRFDHVIKIPKPNMKMFVEYFKSRKIEIAGIDLAEQFEKNNLSMAFAEQFVLWAKKATKKNQISKETALETIEKIKEHQARAKEFCSDIDNDDKSNIGF